MGNIINEISIRKKIVSAANAPKFIKFYYNAANTRFVFARNNLLEDFDNHGVTQELLQDPSIEGSTLVDHGNLVSFLGISDGKQTVAQMREFLRQNVILGDDPKITNDKTRIHYNFPVSLPSKRSADEQFSSPEGWSSRGIVRLIEEGVGNAAYYIFRALGLPNSRSGTGLQRTDRAPRKAGGKFSPKKWISEILENFKSK